MTTQTRKYKVGDTYEGDGKDLPARTVLVDRDGDLTQKRTDGKWLRGYDDDHTLLTYPAGMDKRVVYLPPVKVPKVGSIISTTEEFENLPPKSVVQDRDGDVFQRNAGTKTGGWYLGGIESAYSDQVMPVTVTAPFKVLFVGSQD